MRTGIVLAAFMLAVAGCGERTSAPQQGAEAPQLEAPLPETQPSRVFAAVNEAARTAAPELIVMTTQRLPDAGDAGAGSQEVLSLRHGERLSIEATLTNAMSPATQVQGQTLRALLDIAVEEPQVLVYRVTSESATALCGGEAADYVVLWEASDPGDASLKLLGVKDAAPGAAGARACAMLEYRRG